MRPRFPYWPIERGHLLAWLHRLFPFLVWLPGVTRWTLKADLLAGVTGAVIVLPQAVAFAMIAGLPPEYGLYTAVVTPIIAALFGSSRHLVSGPTTAISIVVFSAVSHHAEPGSSEFISLALTLTFLAGVYQLGFGLARLGALVNFVSHTVVVGFTAGAAILIATSQFKHILGLALPAGESFLHTWLSLYQRLEQIQGPILLVASVTLIAALISRHWLPRIPYLLVGMAAGAIAAVAVGGADQGIKMVGELPAKLPHFAIPELSFSTVRQLAPEAFAVALLGLIEAVSIAKSVAVHSKQRIDGNQEFIGQGLSNLVGSLFSSYAGSGSFTRTGVNYHAGAMSPMSAVFAALILVLIVLLVAPLTAYLPIAAMGAVILLVAYNLVDWKQIRKILFASGSEATILIVTFLATLFLELEFAIYAGVLLSLFFYLKRTARPMMTRLAPDPRADKQRLKDIRRQHLQECPQLRIVQIEGSIFFGAVDHIADRLRELCEPSRCARSLVVVGNGINFIDLAGAELLTSEIENWRSRGGDLFFCRLKQQPREMLVRSGVLRELGTGHISISKKNAIAKAFQSLDHQRCQECSLRIFQECESIKRADPPAGAERTD